MTLALLLSFVSTTPRARLNVVQSVSSLFFLMVVLRHRRASAAGIDPEENLRPSRGPWPALILAGTVYASTIPLYFISDDFAHLYHARTPILEALWKLSTEGQSGTFLRPVTFLSLFMDQRLWHHWPPGYHLTNVFLHLSSVTGVFFLCRASRIGQETAGVAAVLFAVLPVQAEAVTWIAARFDLLATGLTLWSLVFYIRFRNNGEPVNYVAGLFLAFLAVLSKENAFVLPLLLIALELFLMTGRRPKAMLGFLLLPVAVFLYRWKILGGVGGYADNTGQPEIFGIGLKTLEALFIRAPAQLLFGYNWLQPPSGETILLVSLTVAMLFLALGLSSRSPKCRPQAVWFALTWMVAASLPVHPWILVGPGLTNSRVLYMSSVGVALLVAALIEPINGTASRKWFTRILVLLLALGLLTTFEPGATRVLDRSNSWAN